MTRLVVLDFDGTMTDAEAEGAPYREGYLDDLVVLSGYPRSRVDEIVSEVEANILENPGVYGWEFGGRIVAPAQVDPYLRVMPVSRAVLDAAGALMVPTDRDRVLDLLYKFNYGRTLDVFRDGAGEVLDALRPLGPWIVTNSHTEAVQRKVRALGRDWMVDRVVGRARKYQVDDSFGQVPAELRLPGLERPVLLRRRAYHETLERLRAEAGAAWEEVLVCGDIFELDLALPLALGARVVLVANPFTPTYERAFLASHPRAVVLEDLRGLPGVVSGALG